MDQDQPVSRYFNGNLAALPGEYVLDPPHTFVEFVAQHVVVGHVAGRFDNVTGKATISHDPFKSTLEVQIDTASINTHVEARDEDLRSERYFQVERFPAMTFKSTRIITEPDGRWTVEGDLTIRDVVRPVSVLIEITGAVMDPSGKIRVGGRADAKLNRRDFGLITDIDRESGGYPVGSDITITVYSEALLQASDRGMGTS